MKAKNNVTLHQTNKTPDFGGFNISKGLTHLKPL